VTTIETPDDPTAATETTVTMASPMTVSLPSGVVVGAEPGTEPARPGGESLAAQIATANARIDTLAAEQAEAITQRQQGKTGAASAAEQIESLTAKVAEMEDAATQNTVARLATDAGAKDPFAVAALVKGAPDTASAIQAMKVSHPYMFGPAGARRAGADLTNGEPVAPGSTGAQTEAGKFLQNLAG